MSNHRGTISARYSPDALEGRHSTARRCLDLIERCAPALITAGGGPLFDDMTEYERLRRHNSAGSSYTAEQAEKAVKMRKLGFGIPAISAKLKITRAAVHRALGE